mgnify:CR=1 FL=1
MMGIKEEEQLRRNVFELQKQLQTSYQRIDSLVEENRQLKKHIDPEISISESGWAIKPKGTIRNE